MPEAIESVLLSYLAENFLPRGMEIEVAVDENLFETGVLDSAGLLDCVAFLEREFSLTIPDEDLLPDNFSSIASVAAYIRCRQRQMESAVP